MVALCVTPTCYKLLLIHLFLGRDEAFKNYFFFTFHSHILGSLAGGFGLCLVCLVLWVFFTVLLEVQM